MKRQVSIFIETNPLQLDNDFTRLELFNDEKISVTSTIQNISDISKIFTDFSQGFTIPCSPINNGIFQHFYQNDVDASINYQKRFNAFIEINTTLFRRGKIQFEKANLKNGKPDSYSITFYGAGVSLNDYFKEDKLSQLNYSTLDHDYTNIEVFKRVTDAPSVVDHNVRYPLISSKRVWQFGASVPLPTDNLPDWYNYPSNNENNLNHVNGELVYTELFPAVRVASIFGLIQSQYGITFNGIFLLTDFFRKAFLFFKNKDKFTLRSGQQTLLFNTKIETITGTLPNIISPALVLTGTLDGTFRTIYQSPLLGGAANDVYGTVTHNLFVQVVTISIPTTIYLDIYLNNVFQFTRTDVVTGAFVPLLQTLPQTPANNNIYSFKVRSNVGTTILYKLKYELKYQYFTAGVWSTGLQTSTVTCNAVTTVVNSNLASLAPDLKISDFITGICKEFNLTVYSNTKNVYTFDPIPFWYSKGIKLNITKYTDIASIEVERVKLYKSIEFKYQDSECMLNKFFLENPTNQDGHGYGNIKVGFDFDGGEYKIESLFENLLHNNFGNQLQVGYCLNKELAPYIPKPVLLYMNELTTLTGGDHFYWNGQGTITSYMPFGQDAQVTGTNGVMDVSLNFSADISSYFNVPNQNSLYALYYQEYISNLYNSKNRLTKVKVILPVRLLTTLKLNDRLIIRDKRYIINEMQSDLTTGEVNFTLLNDFAEIPILTFVTIPTP